METISGKKTTKSQTVIGIEKVFKLKTASELIWITIHFRAAKSN